MTRKVALVGLAILLVAVIGAVVMLQRQSAPAQPPPLAAVSLRLPIPAADTAFAPYYLAADKGLFAKYGLDVRLEPGTPELNPVKMVGQGVDQFGIVGGPELLLSGRVKGAAIVGIALLHKDSDFVVVVALNDSGITELRDLRGKRVGFFYGHISTDVLHMLFKKENIQVQEIDVGFDYGQLLTRKIDAQWAFRTTAGITLPAKGVKLNFISPAEYGIVTQGHVVIANARLVEENPQLVQRFLSAIVEATAYSADHLNESVEATIRRDPNFVREVGDKQMQIYSAAIKRNERIGWISADDMQRTKQQLADVGLIPADFDVNASYTTRFLRDYYKTR